METTAQDISWNDADDDLKAFATLPQSLVPASYHLLFNKCDVTIATTKRT